MTTMTETNSELTPTEEQVNAEWDAYLTGIIQGQNRKIMVAQVTAVAGVLTGTAAIALIRGMMQANAKLAQGLNMLATHVNNHIPIGPIPMGPVPQPAPTGRMDMTAPTVPQDIQPMDAGPRTVNQKIEPRVSNPVDESITNGSKVAPPAEGPESEVPLNIRQQLEAEGGALSELDKGTPPST
jgi:hypothetical protein